MTGNPTIGDRVEDALRDFDAMVVAEQERGLVRFGPYRSRHEMLGVLYEEFDEVCDAVRHNESDEHLLKELVQVAAIARRAATDLGLLPNDVLR